MDPLAKVLAVLTVVLVATVAHGQEPECTKAPDDQWICPRASVLRWFRSHAAALPVCEAGLKRERKDRTTDLRLGAARLAACNEQVSSLESTLAPPPVDGTWRALAGGAGVTLALLGAAVAALEYERPGLAVPAATIAAAGLALAVVAIVDP